MFSEKFSGIELVFQSTWLEDFHYSSQILSGTSGVLRFKIRICGIPENFTSKLITRQLTVDFSRTFIIWALGTRNNLMSETVIELFNRVSYLLLDGIDIRIRKIMLKLWKSANQNYGYNFN